MKKYSKYRDISPELNVISGPNYIEHAVKELDKLRTLARPTDEYLRSKDLDRVSFNDSLKRIGKSEGERYHLSDINRKDRTRTALRGGTAAGLLGILSTGLSKSFGGSAPTNFGVGLGAGGALGLIEYLRYKQRQRDLYNTSRVLRDYGLFNPNTLRKARPLIGELD